MAAHAHVDALVAGVARFQRPGGTLTLDRFDVGQPGLAGQGEDLPGIEQGATAARIEDLARGRVDDHLVHAAIGAGHVGFPHTIVAFQLVHLGVAGGTQLGLHVGSGQIGGEGRGGGEGRRQGGGKDQLDHGGIPERGTGPSRRRQSGKRA
ncbi:hypothetical protein D9M73_237720 [compost metagenome]